MKKLVFRFNNQGRQESLNSKEILGGKGANLAQMAKLGLPVPAGFTLSTESVDFFTIIIKKYQIKLSAKLKKKLK